MKGSPRKEPDPKFRRSEACAVPMRLCVSRILWPGPVYVTVNGPVSLVDEPNDVGLASLALARSDACEHYIPSRSAKSFLATSDWPAYQSPEQDMLIVPKPSSRLFTSTLPCV